MRGWWTWFPLLLSAPQDPSACDVLTARPDSSNQRNEALVGSWVLSASLREETHIVSKRKSTQTTTEGGCNVCPTLTFQPDHTGFFAFPSGPKEAFTWTTSADSLHFRNSASNRAKELAPPIQDGTYAIVRRNSDSLQAEIGLVRQKPTASKKGRIVDTYVLVKQY